jgi:hypothetical protein
MLASRGEIQQNNKSIPHRDRKDHKDLMILNFERAFVAFGAVGRGTRRHAHSGQALWPP